MLCEAGDACGPVIEARNPIVDCRLCCVINDDGKMRLARGKRIKACKMHRQDERIEGKFSCCEALKDLRETRIKHPAGVGDRLEHGTHAAKEPVERQILNIAERGRGFEIHPADHSLYKSRSTRDLEQITRFIKHRCCLHENGAANAMSGEQRRKIVSSEVLVNSHFGRRGPFGERVGKFPEVLMRINLHGIAPLSSEGSGARGSTRPCAARSCQRAGGIGVAAPAMSCPSSFLLPTPGMRLRTAGWARGKRSAAAGSGTPCASQAAFSARTRATTSSGAAS